VQSIERPPHPLLLIVCFLAFFLFLFLSFFLLPLYSYPVFRWFSGRSLLSLALGSPRRIGCFSSHLFCDLPFSMLRLRVPSILRCRRPPAFSCLPLPFSFCASSLCLVYFSCLLVHRVSSPPPACSPAVPCPLLHPRLHRRNARFASAYLLSFIPLHSSLPLLLPVFTCACLSYPLNLVFFPFFPPLSPSSLSPPMSTPFLFHYLVLFPCAFSSSFFLLSCSASCVLFVSLPSLSAWHRWSLNGTAGRGDRN